MAGESKTNGPDVALALWLALAQVGLHLLEFTVKFAPKRGAIMRTISLVLAALCLVGCAEQPKQVFIRTDGQAIRNNAVLTHQFEIDKTICAGDTQKANMSGTQFCRGAMECAMADIARGEQMKDVAKGCMAQKGYVMVLETESDAKIAEFADINKQAQQPAQAKVQARR
jgi:hypothetical protein